jgi:DNA (cytosine-5)-methyltransferase 1
VKNLQSHDKGQTFRTIVNTLTEELGYHITYRVMDARYWVPQGRQRILIVGFNGERGDDPGFDFDMVKTPVKGPVMRDILHPEDGFEEPEEHYTLGPDAEVNPRYTLTAHLWRYLRDYAAKHQAAGNGFGYGLVGPDDVSRTLSARYYKDGSEILVSRGRGKRPRRLTPRECARLMGFPEDFEIPVSDTQAYKQFGNSVVVPMVAAVAEALRPYILEYAEEPLAAV